MTTNQSHDLRFQTWGGLDSNQRPADYESASWDGPDLQEFLNLLGQEHPLNISVATPFHPFVCGVRLSCGLLCGLSHLESR
jgi:hypothetical protein